MIEGISGVIAVGNCGALGIAGSRTTGKRKRAFWDQYGTYEGFRRQVDAESVRAVRRSRGDIAAVKALRDGYPNVSLAIAKRYVQEL